MSGFTVKRDSGLFIGDVDVAPASGTIEITENGTDIDVARYAKANVNVPTLTTKFKGATTPPYQIFYCEPASDVLYDLEIPLDYEYTQLGYMCCFANSNVKTVTIGDNITSIENGLSQSEYGENNAVWSSAFGYCKNLTDVYGGENITYVGNLSFVGCNHLTNMLSLFNSGNLKTVGECAFYGCRLLNGTIKFNALRTLGLSAFERTQLNNIYILGTDTISGDRANIRQKAFDNNLRGHYDKIIINTNNGSPLNIESYVFSGDNDSNVSVLAILSNDITFSTNTFYNFYSNIIDFYTHLNESDFTTWLSNLPDTRLATAITNATNIHYEYSGDGSEL